jgi:hypothetical protein
MSQNDRRIVSGPRYKVAHKFQARRARSKMAGFFLARKLVREAVI